MPGEWGFLLRFLTRGQSFALKSCPGGMNFDEKISGPGVSPGGGIVTGQIDTCITFASQTKSFLNHQLWTKGNTSGFYLGFFCLGGSRS